jgi:hypothetical protein
MSAPLVSSLLQAKDALKVLTLDSKLRAYIKEHDPKAYEQALDAIDAIQKAVSVAERYEAAPQPAQPVEELQMSVQRYNCLLGLAADNARIGGDIGKAQVFATLALAEATALQVEP